MANIDSSSYSFDNRQIVVTPTQVLKHEGVELHSRLTAQPRLSILEWSKPAPKINPSDFIHTIPKSKPIVEPLSKKEIESIIPVCCC